MRDGFTLAELMILLVLIGVVFGLAIPRARAWRDQRAVNRARDEAALFYERARFAAVMRSRTVRIEFASEGYLAISEIPEPRVLASRGGSAQHGVGLWVSRSVIRLQPNGLGHGAANTKLVFRRGAAAESLTVSRLGRLRRWN